LSDPFSDFEQSVGWKRGGVLNQSARQFRTSDFVMLVLLTGVVISIISAMLARGLKDSRPDQALLVARALAHQIGEQSRIWSSGSVQDVSNRDNSVHGSSNREPASTVEGSGAQLTEGELGRDPWGHPYRYFVGQSNEGLKQQAIFVWSPGPDGKSDSNPQAVLMSQQQFRFSGDDLGFVQITSVSHRD
jgi:hypothetical protein